MKRTHILALMLAAATMWIVAGCDSPTDETTDTELATREQVVDLDDPYGGFSTADEQPAFADPSIPELFGPDLDVAYDDPVENTAVMDRIRDRYRNRPVTFLMITWGNLEADSTIDFPTDWSGGLLAENGVVCLKRTIAFEGGDAILPRTSPDLLEWTSKTMPHFDGVLVSLYAFTAPDTFGVDSTAVDSVKSSPFSLTFRTPPLTVTFTAEELVDLHRVIQVDEAGNAVAFNTLTVLPTPCPVGFLAGQWRPVSDRPGGVFRGKWVSYNGAHMGYLRGVYGPNSDGEKVFFGKWINRGGQFQGLLVGYYGDNTTEPRTAASAIGAGGWFKGVWLNRALRVMGDLGGEWNTRDDAEQPGGHFKGRWRKRC